MGNFCSKVGASKNNPCLLILDGHATHNRNIDVIDLAIEHGVTILVLPAHCIYKLQPLYHSFMKPLKTYYMQEVTNGWEIIRGVISLFQIAKLLGNALCLVCNLFCCDKRVQNLWLSSPRAPLLSKRTRIRSQMPFHMHLPMRRMWPTQPLTFWKSKARTKNWHLSEIRKSLPHRNKQMWDLNVPRLTLYYETYSEGNRNPETKIWEENSGNDRDHKWKLQNAFIWMHRKEIERRQSREAASEAKNCCIKWRCDDIIRCKLCLHLLRRILL